MNNYDNWIDEGDDGVADEDGESKEGKLYNFTGAASSRIRDFAHSISGRRRMRESCHSMPDFELIERSTLRNKLLWVYIRSRMAISVFLLKIAYYLIEKRNCKSNQ